MPFSKPHLRRLSALASVGNWQRLSVGIIVALCAGLLLPALVGGLVLTHLRFVHIETEVEERLTDEISLLANSLSDPVWNIDPHGIRSIVESALLNPEIVRITVSDPGSQLLLDLEHPERRLGAAHTAQRALVADGIEVGNVRVEIDDGLRRRDFNADRRTYFLLVVGQFALSLGLIGVALRRRVLLPLQRLMDFSDRLSQGVLDQPIDWSQPDEIGNLAKQLDRMRGRLKDAFAEQQAILNNVPLGVMFVREQVIQLANRHAETLFGYRAGHLGGLPTRVLFLSEEQHATCEAQLRQMTDHEGGGFENDLRLRRRDGTKFWAHLRGSALDFRAPEAGCILVFENISERRVAAEQLRLAATVFENTADGVLITDAAQSIVAVNRSFQLITGYSEQEAYGKRPSLLKSGQHDAEFFTEMWRELRQQQRWQGEIWNRRKNGEVYPAELTVTCVTGVAGEVDHYVGVFRDVTYRQAAEEEIRKLAFYDALTRLPNRRLMLDRLARALAAAARHHRHGALMLIDLDNFKTLNDTLGHDVGDQLLVAVATRLEGCVRKGDTVARMGGDEFVVILDELDGTGLAAMQSESVARKIQLQLNLPYQLDLSRAGEPASIGNHRCTSSIGIALFIDAKVSADELMKRADTAMYQAKAAGRNTLRFFDPDMQAAVTARASLEVDLRRAMDEHQFILHFQAQVDAEHRIFGAEVLLRWAHPQRGLVPPGEFIRVAEETGLIIPIGLWVLDSVCRQLAAWANKPRFAPLSLALNVSARQFHHDDFAEQVLRALERHAARAERLKLELTESLLVDDVDDVIAKMNRLKAAGACFSLDDFGTGYSSLSYLKRLPLDQLKIDRSFVRDVLSDPNDATIARTVVALGQNLGLAVIAEGVETQGQRDFLVEHGCAAFQGYYFGRPLPLADFEAYVERQQTSSLV